MPDPETTCPGGPQPSTPVLNRHDFSWNLRYSFPVRCLPLITVDLRVRSRMPSHYWGRIMYAGPVMAGLMLVGLLMPEVLNHPGWGGHFLKGLTLLVFLLALESATVTSDVLSSEMREGTLGFLLLTPLRARDIVYGKMIAASIGVLYRLMALLPFLAIGFLIGGTTLLEYLLTVISVLLLYLYCLSTGIFVSSLGGAAHVQSVRAWLLSLPGLVLVSSAAIWCLWFPSPASTLSLTLANLALLFAACVLLSLAPRILERRWQRPAPAALQPNSPPARASQASPSLKPRPVQRLGPEEHPIRWLMQRQGNPTGRALLVLQGTGAVLLLGFLTLLKAEFSEALRLALILHAFFTIMVTASYGYRVSRFFEESMPNPAFHLLTVCPLTNDSILAAVRGQADREFRSWLALAVLGSALLGTLAIGFNLPPAWLFFSWAQVAVVPIQFKAGFWVAARSGMKPRRRTPRLKEPTPGDGQALTLVMVPAVLSVSATTLWQWVEPGSFGRFFAIAAIFYTLAAILFALYEEQKCRDFCLREFRNCMATHPVPVTAGR
jgi:hypothetical protein